jgi:hypothetical protein
MLPVLACNKFLEEQSTGVLPVNGYYTTPEQIQAAVNGCYAGLGSIMVSGIGVGENNLYVLEYLTGYSTRPRSPSAVDNQFLLLDYIDPANGYLENWWNATYLPLENCNSAIAHISGTTVVSETVRQKYLGEVYFLRAWYYFQAVRLFGSIPLKTTPSTDVTNTAIPKAPVEAVYQQIVSDLLAAEQCGLPWTDASGRVTLGAVEALLSKVYITMAGYPLQKGREYYGKAYEKAAEVIASHQFALFDSYADLRLQAKQNTGEHIFMLQRDAINAPAVLHFGLMPYPTEPISVQPDYGGALAPRIEFYHSFEPGDLRAAERQFFYTRYPQYGNPAHTIELGTPYLYKYWDEDAEKTGRSGQNFPLLRYADLLLLCAEAKAGEEGGSTSDATALEAYFQVRKRAFPTAVKPAVITLEQVWKERYWELCYEWQTWFDMLRTHKAFDVNSHKIVDLLGYRAPAHVRPFTEQNLLLPVPLSEVQKNPLLK